jgi:hypothetical protein
MTTVPHSIAQNAIEWGTLYSWNTLYDLSPSEAPPQALKRGGSETILYVALEGPLFHGDEHLQFAIDDL